MLLKLLFPTFFSSDPIHELLAITATPVALYCLLFIVGHKGFGDPQEKHLATSFGGRDPRVGKGSSKEWVNLR